MATPNQTLTQSQKDTLINNLKIRFEKNPDRHQLISWENIVQKLNAAPLELWSLNEMERTEGEPDVMHYDAVTDEYLFFDCAAESRKGRRSLCYDREALNSRKEHKPANRTIDMASEMGIKILTEEQYRYLQTLGKFDLKTSSWIATSSEIRKLGGAIFCDRRYDTVFLYHNGAESYYAARGFRGALRI